MQNMKETLPDPTTYHYKLKKMTGIPSQAVDISEKPPV